MSSGESHEFVRGSVNATAICHHASAVFARHERDLDSEIKKKPFDVQVVFLEDLVS
jgi:hypothetical protein